MKVSAEAARRFLVAHQLLTPPRSTPSGRRGVLEVFRHFGSIQFDPIAVAGRTHDLVLHARVAGYDPVLCDELYERREIFEAYNKGLSLVPTEEFPWFRGILSQGPRRTLEENREVTERVLELAVGVTAEYGQYLVNVTGCHGCHGAQLSGGKSKKPGALDAPNLTPGGELDAWTTAQFVNTVHTGVTPSGRVLNPDEMPWKSVGTYTDDELTAIFMYLQSLPPLPTVKP